MKKISVVTCIDVEPDERLIAPNLQKDWRGFELTYQYFSRLRQRLEDATGSPAHFLWFFRMDAQIEHAYGTAAWAVRRYSSLVEGIKAAGDGIGLHVHAWRWDEKLCKWIVDLADQEWVNHCVRLGFDSFRASLDQPCLYFRFGDRWMNNRTLALVEKLGARFDLTLEPGQKDGEVKEFFTGSFLDYSEVPQYPYRPSKADFRRPGSFFGRKLWVIPLSAGGTDWSPEPPGLYKKDVAAGDYEGYLDKVDCDLISGWVYDRDRPDSPLDVEIYDDNVLLTTATAATFRPDLFASGKGNGRHCFNIVVPAFLKDGRAHLIRVKAAGTNYYLKNSPIELTCRNVDNQENYMTLNLSYNPWSLRRILDNGLKDSKEPYLAAVVRSDAVTHGDEYSNLEQTFDYILSHRSIRALAFEAPDEMLNRRR